MSRLAARPKAPVAAAAKAPASSSSARDAHARQPTPVNQAWFSLATGVQARFGISQPGDPHEREADRVADRVLARIPVGRVGAAPGGVARRMCATCAEELPFLHRKCAHCDAAEHADQGGAPTSPTSPVVHLGSGEPLSTAVRGEFEGRFGQSFESVRIHRSTAAAETAHAIDARAFTYGDHIVFGRGTYDPTGSMGRHLLAHELTHVVQQRGGNASLGIQRMPIGISRGIAGNCISNSDNCTTGTNIHRFIQGLMVSLYRPAMFAEVAIPGGGTGTSCKTSGYVDLYGSFPFGIVPAVPQGHMFPPPFASFPSPAPVPGTVMLGSIKPFTMPAPVALADLATYITAFDAFVALSGSPLSIAQPMIVPTQPAWAIPGLPFPFSPATLPQMIHIFTTFNGMYWYFCRPMIELAWLAAKAAQMIAEMMDELRKATDRLGQQLAYAFQALVAALSAAADAVAAFLSEWGTTILAIVAAIVVVVLIVIFWEVIVALALAAAAAVTAFFAEAAAGATALASLGLLLLLLMPSEANAAEPRQNSQQPPAGVPPMPVSGDPTEAATAAALRRLLERLQGHGVGQSSQTPETASADFIVLLDSAEETIRLVPGGTILVYVLELLRHLLEEQRQQASLPMPPLPPGYNPPPSQGAGNPPPAGGSPPSAQPPSATPPASSPPGATSPPPSAPSSGAPPSSVPPAGAPPSGNSASVAPPAAGARSLGRSGGGASGGGSGGAATPVAAWPIIYEEVGSSGHFQILPDPSVANGTLSILAPTNQGAIMRVARLVDGTVVLQNTTDANRTVAVIAPSSLVSGGFVLVSGPLKTFLDDDFASWRTANRRPRLNDLVFPQLHFR